MIITDAIRDRVNKSDPVRSSITGVGLGTLLQNVESQYAMYNPDKILRVWHLSTAASPDGSSWDKAFRLLDTAIDYARFINHQDGDIDYTDDHHYVILVAPGDYSAEGRIAFSAKNIAIIGIGTPGTDMGVSLSPVGPSAFCFGGSGSGVEIANLAIAVDSAIAGFWWEYLDSCWLHDLVIGDFQAVNQMTYGIYTEGLNNSIIERCRIACAVTGGIHIAGNASPTEPRYCYNSIIRDCIISAVQTCDAAIYVGASMTGSGFLIDHNYIIGDNFTKSIDIDHTAADVMSANNYVHSAGEGGTKRNEVTS